MKKKAKIVRNFAVFCSESALRNAEIKLKRHGKINRSETEYVLSKIFKEQADLDTLLQCYFDARKGNDSCYFSQAFFCDKRHAVRIDAENILLYYYQDRINVGVPWDYPHMITHIGWVVEDSDCHLVAHDLMELSVLDFFMKYYFRKTVCQHTFETISEGYLVDNYLKICIDVHIDFQWHDSNQEYHEQYMADVWWYEKEEVRNDLLNMNLIKFGEKYTAYWGR